MNKLIISFCCILFYSCQDNKNNNNPQVLAVANNDSIKSFTAVEKDSAYFISYQFSKQTNRIGAAVYVYNNDDEKGFIILSDTASKSFKLITNKRDTLILSFESDRIYTVNSKSYKVLKLIADKGVTDGEVSYFFNPEIGLLLSKSNTWRIGKILNPEKNNSDYLELTALFYKVLTDEEFYKTPTPQAEIKFTPPKIE